MTPKTHSASGCKSTFLFVFLPFDRCLCYLSTTTTGQLPAPTDEQLSDVFQKDLVMNVFRNGAFGSFRHVPLQSGCFEFIAYQFIIVYLLGRPTLVGKALSFTLELFFFFFLLARRIVISSTPPLLFTGSQSAKFGVVYNITQILAVRV